MDLEYLEFYNGTLKLKLTSFETLLEVLYWSLIIQIHLDQMSNKYM